MTSVSAIIIAAHKPRPFNAGGMRPPSWTARLNVYGSGAVETKAEFVKDLTDPAVQTRVELAKAGLVFITKDGAKDFPAALDRFKKAIDANPGLKLTRAETNQYGELLLAAPRQPGKLFGLMMNLRTHPQYRRIKDVLDSGGLGSFQRMQWTITNWFRPEAYYTMSNWRATWKGEGGGVLINQALHNLDVLQWLCGMPVAVRAFCKFGQDHDIEVEDSVIAYLEFANGATGVFTTKTGEAPGVNRLEIAGSGGLMVLENEHLVVTKNKVDIREYSRTTDNAFGVPEKTVEEFPNRDEYPSHAGVISNFVEAVLDGKPLIAEASEGLKSVELANAMVYSTWKDTRVALPLDAATYQASLDQAIATSKPRHRQIKEAKVDMKKSYS